MRIAKIFLITVIMFGIAGCSGKNYTKQKSAFIVFKTATFRYADLGFMYESSDDLKVELYSSGQAVMALEISKSSVCMSLLECMSKKSFNQIVLSSAYPPNLIDNVFRGKRIFNGENILHESNGFTQNISKDNKYNIHYSVLTNQIIFHDTINKIVIKIKEM